MSDIVETAPPAVPRDRSVEARRAARQAKARRERRIIEFLNPRRFGRRDRGARGRRREAHARARSRHSRSPHARAAGPVLRVAGEPSRGGAPRVLGAMSGSDLQAVDRVSRSCASSIAITVSSQQSAGAFPSRPKRPRKSPHGSRRTSPSGVARKWRRKGLKRLNPRPEMVWPRKRPDPQDMVQSATAPRRLSPPPTKLLARSRRRRPARKWSRKSSRRLNPRPEMVRLRKARAPKIWRQACEPLVSPAAAKPSGARRVSLRMTLNGVRGLLEAGSVSDDVVAREGNFPPRKPLISHETGKESRSAIRFGDSLGKSARGGVRRERRHQHFRNSGRPCYPPAFPPGVIAPSRAAPHENRRTRCLQRKLLIRPRKARRRSSAAGRRRTRSGASACSFSARSLWSSAS